MTLTPGLVERLRAGSLLYNRGPDYEPIPVPPSELNLEAANTLEALQSRLSQAEADLAGARGWRPIESAPKDGRLALVYRPLARNSSDEPVAVKRLIGGNHHCWSSTVPDGEAPCNPTDGLCHVTHWMPFPDPSAPSSNTEG